MNKIAFIAVVIFSLNITGNELLCATHSENCFFHVKIEGTEIPVLVRGNIRSDKLILYINGGPGLTSIDVARADMYNWSAGLEENFAMAYYDQRGCGNAQGNFDESTLTISQYIKDLDAIITVLNAKYKNADIYLMGHSFGGFIGINYLTQVATYNNRLQCFLFLKIEHYQQLCLGFQPRMFVPELQN